MALPLTIWVVGLSAALADDGASGVGGQVRGAVASAAGLGGQWCLLLVAVLGSRLPALGRVYDQREVHERHAGLGAAAVTLMGAHIALKVLDEPDPAKFRDTSSLLAAILAAGMIATTAVTAVPRVPAWSPFEQWFRLHRLALAGVILSLWHEWTGPSVGAHPLASGAWLAAHVLVLVLYVGSRIVRPHVVNRAHRFRIKSVRTGPPVDAETSGRVSEPGDSAPAPAPAPESAPESAVGAQPPDLQIPSGIWRVTIDGRDLDRLGPRGASALGYAHVRFRVQDRVWLDAHPMSVARVAGGPGGIHLEVLFQQRLRKDPNLLSQLRTGDKVRIDGFHGQMTAMARRTGRVAVFANGLAAETVIPLLLDLRASGAETVAVLRLSEWGRELSARAREVMGDVVDSGVAVTVLPGRSVRYGRRERRRSWLGDGIASAHADFPADIEALRLDLTPDRRDLGRRALDRLLGEPGAHEVFVQGNRGWCRKVVADLRRWGVRPHLVHREYPAWDPVPSCTWCGYPRTPGSKVCRNCERPLTARAAEGG